MSAINTTSAEQLQNYTRKFWDTLSTRAYLKFDSIQHATVLTGVKGQIVLTDLEIGDLAKRASVTFQPQPNIIKYRPRLLTTVAADIDFEINPKVFANSYLEALRASGQNGKDIPYEGQVMGGLVLKIAQEREIAFWKAVQTNTPSSLDRLNSLFNGAMWWFKSLRATNTAVPVPGGAYTKDNILKHFADMYLSLGTEAIEEGVESYGSRKNLFLYIEAYKAKHNGMPPTLLRNKKGIVTGCELENGVGYYYAKPAWGTSDFVVMTQRGNIVFATDEMGDADSFKFVDQIKTIQFTTQYNIGMQIRFGESDYVAVNDLD